MKFLNSKTSDLFADGFCTLLLGTPVCVLLFPIFRMDVSWGECLLFMLVNTVLIVLFSRKWWLLPSFLGFAVLLVVVISSLLETNEALLSYISGFFQWCADGYPDTLPYSVNASMLIVHAAYVLPVAILIFVYFRKLFFFYILPPTVLAMLISAVLSKSAALWPIVIMLLFVLFVSLAKMRGNRISNREANGITSAMLSVSAILLMPVLLCAAFLIGPANNTDWQCKPLVNAVQDVIDYLGFNPNKAPSDGSFNMALTGFSPLENRLGGDIAVNNDIALRVKTKTPVRLTGVIFDTYDGSRWYDSFSRQRYRLQSLFSSTQRSEAFGLNQPGGSPEIQALAEKLTMPAELNVTSSLQGRTLFFAGKMTSINSQKPDTADIFFNNQSELFTLKSQQQFNYSFRTVVFNTEAPDFDKNMLALEKLTAKDPDSALKAVKAEYLQLPDTLPQSVYDTALDIVSGSQTPYEKALAIRSWLSSHCDYTLTPGNPPEDEDFVASFLQHKKGYCVYFASAMTVMSRCVDLPARYVIGFGLKRSPFTKADDSYVATNAMAHAWTEIYFQGIGWVPFDATSWNFDDDAIIETSQQSSNFAPPVPTPGSDMTADLNRELPQAQGFPQALLIILIVLGVLLVLTVLYVVNRYIAINKRGYGVKQSRKNLSSSERLDVCYRRILLQAACLGIRQHPSDTIMSFAQRVDERLREQKMTDACSPVVRMRFGREEPTTDDVNRLSAFSDELEQRLRRELGLAGYLWARVIKIRRL